MTTCIKNFIKRCSSTTKNEISLIICLIFITLKIINKKGKKIVGNALFYTWPERKVCVKF